MIARAGSGWQTVLADLSLILFMTMAAAVSETPRPSAAAPARPGPAALPALAQPVAVWRDGGGDLQTWLDQSGADPRLRLTILAAPDQAPRALALAAGAGRPARVVLEGVPLGPVQALLSYDQDGLAQTLQQTLPMMPARPVNARMPRP